LSEVISQKYSSSAPSNQSFIDAIGPIWKTKFPEDWGITAGGSAYFDVDNRVQWAEDTGHCNFEGASVLELGPFEGYNTYQLAKKNPAKLVALEGNNINFLKTLVVKEMLNFDAEIKHGDFLSYLKNTRDKFDIVWASGVLYHQTEPLEFLDLLSKITDTIFFWTHAWGDIVLEDPENYHHFDPSSDEVREFDGRNIKHYYRSYLFKSSMPKQFSGGSSPFAMWLKKEEIYKVLEDRGFKIIKRAERESHAAGPSISFLATR